MVLYLNRAGHEWDAGKHSWTSTDSMLYALGVGAGADDPLTELAYTTENSHDVEQRVLPTFAVLFAGLDTARLGDFDLGQVLPVEQTVTVHGALPPSGTVRSTARLANVYDEAPNALIAIDTISTDAASGQLLAEVRTTIFVRGEGGFGGDRGTTELWAVPERAADHVVTYRTRLDQALLYRLSGDRNPLHSDPWLAARAGFDRPVLHGLCTYGFTGRALLHTLCGSDPATFGSMSAHFAAPVLPGQELEVHIWDQGGTGLFRTLVGETVVLDRGVFSKNVP